MTPKESILSVVKVQAENASYQKIIQKIYLERMIALGLDEVKKGKILDHEELKKVARSWYK
jgi:hypothetical protein